MKLGGKKNPPGRGRSKTVSKNKYVTRSGKIISVPRTLTERWVGKHDAKEQRKAERLAGLPKARAMRFLAHFQPKRVFRYWFSRDGVIMALKLMGLGAVVVTLLIIGAFAYFRKDLPNLKDISGNNIGGSVRYYDRTGATLLWEDYDAVKRIPVKNQDIAQVVKDATVSIEDKDFFKHGGFDVKGIARAGYNNFVGHGSTQGGSTITQQLVKLTQDWTKDRTYSRKAKELILAVSMESSYTKDEILTGYMNTAPYGGIEYGVEAASRDYFQKAAKDLTLSEAAMLAAIPKSPRYYSPYSSDFEKDAFLSRQHYILDLMLQQGKITKTQHDDAKKVDVIAEVKPRQSKYDAIRAPWFVLAAKKQLEDTKGEATVKRGGWTVVTTLDLNLQNIAEEQVQKGMTQIRRQGGDTAAFAAEDVKTGQMVALVGGSDFRNPDYGQINYAQTNLPPGSSFKPYDYTSLVENTTNVGAGTVLYDSQGALEGYPCTNKANPKQGGNCLHDYDFRFPGPMTIRYAIGGSRNIPAVKAMLIAGVDKTIKTADRLMDPRNGTVGVGYNCFYDELLTKQGPCYGSSAIGDGAFLHLDEHVHGYASLSRNGLNIPQTYILKITDASNKVVDEWKPTKGEQIVRQDSAYIIDDILSDPNPSYFPAGLKPHRYTNSQGTWKFGMKTGTTNDAKDAWMMGMSTQYAIGVWAGQHTRRIAMSGSMETMTLPIWNGWMKAAHKDLKPVDRQRPSDLQTLPAFVVRSHVGLGSVEPSIETDLFPSWYKPNTKNSGPRTIDIVSNKLATDCTPDRAKKQITDKGSNDFSGDKFVTPGGITDEQDDAHKCEDIKPSIDALTISSNSKVSVTVHQGTHPLSSDAFAGVVNFIANGQVLQAFNVDTDGQTVTYDASEQPAGTEITAQVIDSVLYDASTTNSVTTTLSVLPLKILTPSANQTIGSGSTTLTWIGGDGTYSVTLKTGAGPPLPVASCTNTSSLSCNLNLLGPNGTTYTAEVDTDTATRTVSFKK